MKNKLALMLVLCLVSAGAAFAADKILYYYAGVHEVHGGKTKVYNGANVDAYDGAQATAYDNAVVTAKGDGPVNTWGPVKVVVDGANESTIKRVSQEVDFHSSM